MNDTETPYRVIVMGKTGSGKSSVLNSLTNTKYFRVSSSIMSETREVQSFRGKFKGCPESPDIVFIDTPGFFDSSSKDNKIIAKIALSLHQIGDGVNLVLFCFPAYEIRLDSSMQASWRFLRLIMGNAVYEHVVIVLTHGSRLTPQELENSVARMTTEFIPYLRNNLKCKVKEEILIFKKGSTDDGLNEVLNYIVTSRKYKPEVMKDLGKFWNPKDPLGSVESLLKNSMIFNKIREMLTEVKDKNESIQSQLKQIKHEMKHITLTNDKETKKQLSRFAYSVNARLKVEKESVETLREELGNQMIAMQQRLDEKNKQIDILWKELNELKTKPKLYDSLTTRATEKTTSEHERLHNSKSLLEEDIGYSKHSHRERKNETEGKYTSTPYLNNWRGVKDNLRGNTKLLNTEAYTSSLSRAELNSNGIFTNHELDRNKHKKTIKDSAIYKTSQDFPIETVRNTKPIPTHLVQTDYEEYYMSPICPSKFNRVVYKNSYDTPQCTGIKKTIIEDQHGKEPRRLHQVALGNPIVSATTRNVQKQGNTGSLQRVKKASLPVSRKAIAFGKGQDYLCSKYGPMKNYHNVK